MKLLFLAHRVPYPPNKGDKIRSYHELCAFVEHGHEVHLLTFADDVRDLSYQVDLARLCASVQVVRLHRHPAKLRSLTRLVTGKPLSLGYYASRKMKRLVDRIIARHEIEAVFAYSSTMAQYVPRELSSCTVIDLVDVDSEKWRAYAETARGTKSWIYNLEWRRLRRYEYEIVSRFAHTVLTTQREASMLDQLDEFTRRARLHLITNGVDLSYFQPGERTVDSSSRQLVFTGAMDYYANVEGVCWFVKEIFPLILGREPAAELFIVGSNPTNEVKKLGNHKGVIVTGFVDDVRPYLSRASVCVIPLRIARGVQNKILEAMAAGKAIVSTPEAVAGLRAEDGEQLLIASTPQDFAEATLKIINDETLRNQLEVEARRFVEAEHDWDPLLQRLCELVESVAVRRPNRTNSDSRAFA